MVVRSASVPAPSRLPRLLESLGVGWFVAAILSYAGVEWRISKDTVLVTLLAREHDAEGVRAARATRDARDDVAEIYGTPVGTPIELVVPGGAHSPLLRTPAEAPERRLMPAEHLARLGVRTPTAMRATGALFTIGLAGAGLTAYLIGRGRRRRATDPVHPPPP